MNNSWKEYKDRISSIHSDVEELYSDFEQEERDGHVVDEEIFSELGDALNAIEMVKSTIYKASS